MAIKSPRISWLAKKVRGKKILDIGFIADEGKVPEAHIAIRANNPNAHIVGLDSNERKVKEYNFPNSVVADARKIPFPDAGFDAVVMAEVIEHIIEPYPILREIARVLEPEGRFYLTTVNPYAFFSFLKYWVFQRKVFKKDHYRSFLGNYDHKIFWEPMSLCNILETLHLEVIELTTKNLGVPYLPNLFNKILDINIWPLNKMGGYYCLIAVKK